jgi:hypothetical protein
VLETIGETPNLAFLNQRDCFAAFSLKYDLFLQLVDELIFKATALS